MYNKLHFFYFRLSDANISRFTYTTYIVLEKSMKGHDDFDDQNKISKKVIYIS